MICPPFSLSRMTWIEPSSLWLMERNNERCKANQERLLAVRIKRSSWEWVLSQVVLASFDAGVHAHQKQWRSDFDSAPVQVQWNPERSLSGKKLDYRSIQVGIVREVIRQYAEQWRVEIEDVTDFVHRITKLRDRADLSRAKRLLPLEKAYALPMAIGRQIGISLRNLKAKWWNGRHTTLRTSGPVTGVGVRVSPWLFLQSRSSSRHQRFGDGPLKRTGYANWQSGEVESLVFVGSNPIPVIRQVWQRPHSPLLRLIPTGRYPDTVGRACLLHSAAL